MDIDRRVGQGIVGRAVVPALGFALVIALMLIRASNRVLYDDLLWAWGVAARWPPFIDLYRDLSAVICYQQGVDVYVTNPCDVLDRIFNYSPLVLGLSVFHVGYGWITPAGLVLTGLFFLSLAALPQPRGAFAWTATLLASFSTMTVFALERQNFDVFQFLLAVVAGRLICRPRLRGGGYALAVLAALLKYYPIVLLVVALRERRALFITIAGLAAAAVAVMLALFPTDLAHAFGDIPGGPYFTDLFSARDLPDGLASLASHADFAKGGRGMIIAWGVLAVLLVASARGAARIASNADMRTRLAALPAAESVYLVMGGAVIVGCFLAIQSVGYRGIFFLLLLPGLLTLARARGAPAVAALARRTTVMVLFLMWGECFREAIESIAAYYGLGDRIDALRLAFWFGRELVWWRVITVLVGLLICFALDSPTLRSFRWLPRRA